VIQLQPRDLIAFTFSRRQLVEMTVAVLAAKVRITFLYHFKVRQPFVGNVDWDDDFARTREVHAHVNHVALCRSSSSCDHGDNYE
jgi:hypothetical protein